MATVNVSFSFTPQLLPAGTLAGATRVQLHLGAALKDVAYLAHPATSAVFINVADGAGYVASVQRMNNTNSVPVGAAATSAPFDVQTGVMVDIPGGVAVTVS